jgi:hypothetical protein
VDSPTVSPQELAVQIWGRSQMDARSPGQRQIRRIARELYPDKAPGKGGRWHFTLAQAAAIRRRIAA